MIWLVFALAAALTTAGYRVVTRHVMKAHSPYAYALLINLFGTFMTLPLIWTDFSWDTMPTHWWAWLLVAASTVLWCIIMVLAFESMKLLPVSRREQISQVEIIFVLIFGLLFLREFITPWKAFGGVLVIGGALIAASGKTSIYSGWRSRGVWLTIGVAALYALVAIVDKAALAYFPTGLYTFMLYFLPLVVLATFLLVKKNRVATKHLIEKKTLIVIGATLLSVSSYYFVLRAYDLADASTVYPIMKLSLVFAVLGGLLFFKEERVQIPRKLIATALVLIGAGIIAGGALW